MYPIYFHFHTIAHTDLIGFIIGTDSLKSDSFIIVPSTLL